MNYRSKLIYDDLIKRYRRATIDKNELAKEFGVSLGTINRFIARGEGIPNFRRLGSSVNSKIVFSIVDTAMFISGECKGYRKKN